MDINSDEVKKLYNYILKNSDYQELTVYQTKKVTVEDMNNKLKLMTIFLNLEDKSLDETTHEFYSKEVVEEKAREIFGQNVEIHHESCSIVFGEEIDFKDGQYDRYRTKREGRTQWEFSKNVIISAEKKDDELNIYDKYIHIYSDQERGGETFYSASDKKEEIMEDEVKTFKHNFKKNSDGSYYWVSTEPIQ